jgi:hypothetical protein
MSIEATRLKGPGSMKFLLLVNEKAQRPHEANPTGLNRTIREHVSRLLEDGTLDCAYYLLPHGGACIINASSHEALLYQIRSWPASSQHDFQIHVLCDIFQAIDDNFLRAPPSVAETSGPKGGAT